MPEQEQPSDLNFNQLDAALSEPAIERVSKTARIYNELLRDEEISHSEALKIVSHLDEEWGVLRRSPVTITGRITLEEDEEAEAQFVQEVAVISDGFNVIRDATNLLEHRHKVVHRFMIPIPDDTPMADGKTHTAAWANIDDVAISTSRASYERAVAWLSVFEPGLVEEIDKRILNAPGSEANAIMALKGLNFTMNADDAELATSSIDKYIGRLIEFDTQVPYGLRIDGTVYIHKEQTSYLQAQLNNGRILGQVTNVLPVSNENGHELAIVVDQVRSDRAAKGHTLIVPLSSLVSIISIRESYYSS